MASPAWGALTYVSMSGVSNKDESILTKPVGYAGITGDCANADGLTTCDTCTGEDRGGTKLWPCNRTNVYKSLKFGLRVSHTLTGLINANSEASLKDGTIIVSGANFAYDSGGANILSLEIPWLNLCTQFATTGTGGTPCNFDKTLTLELTPNNTGTGTGGGTQSFTFRLVAREVVVGTTPSDGWFYTGCPPAQPTASGYGFCHFEAYPGDEKIYTNNMRAAAGFPSTPAAAVEFNKVVFFYAPYDGASDLTTLQGITNANASYEVAVSTAASPPVADNRLEGLANGQRYCFAMANQDITGILSYFTPTSGADPNVNATDLCNSPSQVVGLLDDKECFIATAAFGSVMAPQVQTFRDFRDRYLLPHSWGKKFVKFYYETSPEAVHYLMQSEVLRASARWALWPLLWFAQLSLQYGVATVLGGVLTAALGAVGVTKLGKRYL